jgi:hypothetical protein
VEQLGDDGRTLGGGLPLAVDGLGEALAECTMVIDFGEPEVGEGQPTKPMNGLIGGAGTRAHIVE